MGPLSIPQILAGFLLLGSSAGLTWVVRATAIRFHFVSAPREERWHQKTTAIMGGVGIYLSFLLGFLLFVPKEQDGIILMICASSMFLVGLVDDFLHLKPQTKLIAQIVASVTLISFGLILPFFNSQLLNFGITLLWLVGITNAMNLLDNMDGLCAGIAIIGGIYRLIFCGLEGHTAGVMMALVFVAALGGFLIFNFNPASIFMGDSGSLFMGFTLAGMNLATNHAYAKSLLSILLFPVLILIIPIFDTAFVSLVRKLSGRSISAGGKDHSSHRLVAIGLSERTAVLVLWSIAALSGAIAYSLYRIGFSYSVFTISLFVIGMVLFGIYLSKVQVYDSEALPAREKNVFQLAATHRHSKQVFLVILDVVLILTSYYGAYTLRFGGLTPGGEQFERFIESLPVLLVAMATSFFLVGMYRYDWRYTGLRDLWVMVKGSLLGTTATVLALTYLYRFQFYSRAVFVVYWGTLIILLAATRLSFRMLTELLAVSGSDQRKVLIYGAGDGGELLLREFKNNQAMNARVVGFLDDNPFRLRTKIHGIPVLGEHRSAEFWIRKHEIGQIIISSRKIDSDRIQELQQVCSRNDVELLRAYIKFEEAS